MAFLLLIGVIAALALVAFCAGAETGFLSIRRGRLIHLARAGGVRAGILQAAHQNLDKTTAALLVGGNLANVTYSSLSSALSQVVFPGSPFAQSLWGAVAAMTVLYFGEFAPKLLCAARPLRRMLLLAPVWQAFAVVFVPVGAFIQSIVCRFIPKRDVSVHVTPDAVLKILADRKDGVKLSGLERALVARILLLRSRGEFITPDALLPALDECD